MGDMADYEIVAQVDAVISGNECPVCGFPLYDAPGCQCPKVRMRVEDDIYDRLGSNAD